MTQFWMGWVMGIYLSLSLFSIGKIKNSTKIIFCVLFVNHHACLCHLRFLVQSAVAGPVLSWYHRALVLNVVQAGALGLAKMCLGWTNIMINFVCWNAHGKCAYGNNWICSWISQPCFFRRTSCWCWSSRGCCERAGTFWCLNGSACKFCKHNKR